MTAHRDLRRCSRHHRRCALARRGGRPHHSRPSERSACYSHRCCYTRQQRRGPLARRRQHQHLRPRCYPRLTQLQLLASHPLPLQSPCQSQHQYVAIARQAPLARGACYARRPPHDHMKERGRLHQQHPQRHCCGGQFRLAGDRHNACLRRAGRHGRPLRVSPRLWRQKKQPPTASGVGGQPQHRRGCLHLPSQHADTRSPYWRLALCGPACRHAHGLRPCAMTRRHHRDCPAGHPQPAGAHPRQCAAAAAAVTHTPCEQHHRQKLQLEQ